VPVAGLDQLAADYLGDRSKLRTITRDDLRTRLRDGDVVVLDVRPEAEYTAAHIRGAISIPIADLKSRLGDIPDGADVVAYCRGPYCVYADEAVRILTKKGRTAARLEGGFPEWAMPASRSPAHRNWRSAGKPADNRGVGARQSSQPGVEDSGAPAAEAAADLGQVQVGPSGLDRRMVSGTAQLRVPCRAPGPGQAGVLSGTWRGSEALLRRLLPPVPDLGMPRRQSRWRRSV